MWFTVELPQPAVVTEVQFESMTDRRRPRRRGAAPGAPAPRRRSSAIRAATRVQVSTDGKDVEQAGRRRQGRRRAHDDRVRADARKVRPDHADRERGRRAAWSIRNLRIYEAPGAARK